MLVVILLAVLTLSNHSLNGPILFRSWKLVETKWQPDRLVINSKYLRAFKPFIVKICIEWEKEKPQDTVHVRTGIFRLDVTWL